jgi:hypothetical protein
MQNGGKNIVFIGGVPRSGTTLVQTILDSHSTIFGGPEFDHIPDLVELRKGFLNSIRRGRIHIYFDKAQFDRKLCGFMEALIWPIAERHSCTLISEKTPSNLLYFKELADICPNARFIFVLRDPRAVLASMKRVRQRALTKGQSPRFFVKNSFASLDHIAGCLERGFIACEAIGDRLMRIQYEDLVCDAENVSRSICRFLHVDWEIGMIHPESQYHSGQVTVDGIWGSTKQFERKIDTHSLNRWEIDLTPLQQYLANRYFKNNRSLRDCGYDFSCRHIPIWTRLTGELLFVSHMYYRRLMRFIFHQRLCNCVAKNISHRLRYWTENVEDEAEA